MGVNMNEDNFNKGLRLILDDIDLVDDGVEEYVNEIYVIADARMLEESTVLELQELGFEMQAGRIFFKKEGKW
jgi:hypothetical protein